METKNQEKTKKTTGNEENKELTVLLQEAQSAEGEAVTGAKEPEPTASSTEATEVISSEEVAALLGETIQGMFAMRAQKRGAHWNLPDDQAARLGKQSERVLDKYLGSIVGKIGPELACAFSFAAVLRVRLVEDKKLVKESKDKTDIGGTGEARARKEYRGTGAFKEQHI